jgi:hypothetical protein
MQMFRWDWIGVVLSQVSEAKPGAPLFVLLHEFSGVMHGSVCMKGLFAVAAEVGGFCDPTLARPGGLAKVGHPFSCRSMNFQGSYV